MVAELDAQTHTPSSPSSSRHQHAKAHYDSKHPHHHHHHHPTSPPRGKAENLVLKVLKLNPGENRTFGENLIFILNRLSALVSHTLFRILRSRILNGVLRFQTAAVKKRRRKICVSRYLSSKSSTSFSVHLQRQSTFIPTIFGFWWTYSSANYWTCQRSLKE